MVRELYLLIANTILKFVRPKGLGKTLENSDNKVDDFENLAFVLIKVIYYRVPGK